MGLNISKSVKILPGVRVRYNIHSGITLVLGGMGITYTLPVPLPQAVKDKITQPRKTRAKKSKTVDTAPLPTQTAAERLKELVNKDNLTPEEFAELKTLWPKEGGKT